MFFINFVENYRKMNKKLLVYSTICGKYLIHMPISTAYNFFSISEKKTPLHCLTNKIYAHSIKNLKYISR